jgi:hypothetical protein
MPPTKEELREYDAAELKFKKSLGDLPASDIKKRAQEFKTKWFSGEREPVEEPVTQVMEEPVEEPVVEVKEEPVEETITEPEEGEIIEDTTDEKSSDEEIPY